MNRKHLLILFTAIGLMSQCKDPYKPEVTSTDVHYLVVDGTISGGAGAVTAFTISHTTPINDSVNGPLIDAAATVRIESNDGQTFPLAYDPSDQRYEALSLPLQAGTQYRLYVKSGSQEYLSDYTPYKISPPIDSVYGVQKNGGMQLYVNTHDPSGNSQYYRWSFVETWEYHAAYDSELKFDTLAPDFDPQHPDLVERPFAERMRLFTCWHTFPSHNLLLGTSSQLNADVINQSPLFYINPGEERLQVLYSTLVTQTVLSREAYNYWVNVKKITEQIGDIFGPLPSEVHGNIHNVNNPSEVVVGYVNASSASTLRVFIKRPNWWLASQGICQADTVHLVPGDRWLNVKAVFSGPGYVPLLFTDFKRTLVQATSITCVDCTLMGGYSTRPDYWPN